LLDILMPGNTSYDSDTVSYSASQTNAAEARLSVWYFFLKRSGSVISSWQGSASISPTVLIEGCHVIVTSSITQ